VGGVFCGGGRVGGGAVLWYVRCVLDVITRHMASFPTRRLKIFVVHKAYVIFQHAFSVD